MDPDPSNIRRFRIREVQKQWILRIRIQNNAYKSQNGLTYRYRIRSVYTKYDKIVRKKRRRDAGSCLIVRTYPAFSPGLLGWDGVGEGEAVLLQPHLEINNKDLPRVLSWSSWVGWSRGRRGRAPPAPPSDYQKGPTPRSLLEFLGGME
jgi:hypothetical protein